MIMRIARSAVLPLLLAAVTSPVFTQTSAATPAGPTFDVVSIKRNTTAITMPPAPAIDRPDGGFTRTRIPVGTLIARAYPPAAPIEMIGLPGWARTEQYDVSATSTLARATSDDRIAMLRAMLADRFKLAVHVEKRDVPVYELVLARSDGRLGPGITPTEIDCVARRAADRAASEAALAAGTPPPRPSQDIKAPPPPCTLRTIAAVLRDLQGDRQGRLGDLIEGTAPMDTLATMLKMDLGADRDVVDKTGLTGSYRVTMSFDGTAARRGLDAAAAPGLDAPPSIFTAVRISSG